MKNEVLKNIAGVVLLYLILILGIVLINARMGETTQAISTFSNQNISGNWCFFFIPKSKNIVYNQNRGW